MLDLSKPLPVVASRNFVLFPERTVPLIINRPQSIKAIDRAAAADMWIVVVAQRSEADDKNILPKDLFHYGTLAKIEKIVGGKDHGYQLTIRGDRRVKFLNLENVDGYLNGRVEIADDIVDCDEATRKVLVKSVKTLANEILELIPADTRSLAELVDAIDDLSVLLPMCVESLEIPLSKKQEILETLGVKARTLLALEMMAEQKESLKVQSDIRHRLQQKIGKQQREAILREQMAAIRKELGDEDGEGDSASYVQKIQAANLPEAVKKVGLDEAKRLESIGSQSPETHVIRNYLDLLLTLPWNEATTDQFDLDAARAVLNEDHFGLDKIKKRIVQHLAVMKLKQGKKGSILLFVGPPGVGKTSLGESIAKAMGRKFVRVAVGGVRDDAEIRGHRKTYVGAMPGRVIQGMKRIGVNNPVFLLDEIDKLGRGYGGDPAAALLEVLDPEQNQTFTDHYLDVPYDLSHVFFIATANSLDSIPGPLLDRMEVIDLSGYTTAEKLHIAKRHLWPKQLAEHGLEGSAVQITDSAILKIIHGHTREAGVRDLQRKIQMVCRWAAEKTLEGTKAKELSLVNEGREAEESKAVEVLQIDSGIVSDIFGSDRFTHDVTERLVPAGVVTGLAWTPVGGDILFIEATQMPGTGKLILTGQLGDVMKESAQIALSLVRSNLAAFIPGGEFDKRDIHIHVPSGAIPKDGPSAGVAMLTTLASLMTGNRVSPKLAMTGEITLRGSVTPVGGIKEKVLAAHRAGVEHVILPRRNEKDLADIPEDVRNQLVIHLVDHVNEVIEIALGMHDVFAPLALPPAMGETSVGIGMNAISCKTDSKPQ